MRSMLIWCLALSPTFALAQAAAGPTAQEAQAQRQAEAALTQAERARIEAETMAAEAQSAAEAASARALAMAELASRAPTEQEELALAALEGLMGTPPERALPLLKRVLGGSQSDLVKARALFVLSQYEQPEAQAILLNLAREGQGALRHEAIRNIGIGGDAKSLSALREIYVTGDPEVRESVLSAYLIANRREEVLALAKGARTDSELAAPLRTLGAMGAVAELRELGAVGKHSRELVQAYAVSGDQASLLKLAREADSLDIQVEAVQALGIVGNESALGALRSLYRDSPKAEVREAALQGLMIAGDEQGLLQLYRSSKTPAEKTEILRTLTMVGGDAALQAIDAALQGEQP